MGADYQRTTPLPDGRVLWTFQDAEVRRADGSTTQVHNIGMVQNANCFSVLIGGTANDPRPWLFAESTTPFVRWYWPLGAEIGADGSLYVFAAEMNERSPGYLVRTEPSATMNRVTVGRVPRGQLSAAPTYWTGRGWSADPAAAVPVIETADRMVNATECAEQQHLDGDHGGRRDPGEPQV